MSAHCAFLRAPDAPKNAKAANLIDVRESGAMRIVRQRGATINWIIKASKLCNLRCRYCYEWNELANPARVSLDQWDRLLQSIRWYHHRRAIEASSPVETVIIWHGGEPLLLPTEYILEVMRIQRRWLGHEIAEGAVRNIVQTNLYRVSDAHLDVLERENIAIGISMDVFGGVRVDAAGRETETRVAANIERLQDRGVPFGGIAVLAAHTKDRLRRVYDFFEGLGAPLRVLPLFDAPLNVPGASFHLSYQEMISALRDLFRYWLSRRRPIPVHPLVDYLDVVQARRTGSQTTPYDRERTGEWAIMVNTCGTLYQVPDAYDGTRALGNAFEQPFSAIVQSRAYRDSLTRDWNLREQVCGPCEYRGACSTLPLFHSRRADWHGERCPIAYDMHVALEDDLRRRRMGPHRTAAFQRRVCAA
jgi:uncharacterized protein